MDSAEYCKICGTAFINESILNQHVALVHKNSLFQCQSCNLVLADEKEFSKHMETHYAFQDRDNLQTNN